MQLGYFREALGPGGALAGTGACRQLRKWRQQVGCCRQQKGLACPACRLACSRWCMLPVPQLLPCTTSLPQWTPAAPRQTLTTSQPPQPRQSSSPHRSLWRAPGRQRWRPQQWWVARGTVAVDRVASRGQPLHRRWGLGGSQQRQGVPRVSRRAAARAATWQMDRWLCRSHCSSRGRLSSVREQLAAPPCRTLAPRPGAVITPCSPLGNTAVGPVFCADQQAEM